MNETGIRILVLDDEPFMLKLLARMLANLGFTAVRTCDNGRAALMLVDSPEYHPELILLDINMPHMDGVEFLRHLVEHDFSGSVILVSGEDERVLQSVEKLVRAHKIMTVSYTHLRAHETGRNLVCRLLLEKKKKTKKNKKKKKKKKKKKNKIHEKINKN